jgi:beta-glucanase (GH16 family)
MSDMRKIRNKWINFRANFLLFFKIKADDINWRLVANVTTAEVYKSMSKSEFDENYHLGMNYGYYHPNYTYQWYDKSARKLSPKGLELFLTDNVYKDGSVEINRGVGVACSKYNLSYGLYEWSVVPPKGKELWWAIWLTNTYTWPPEIDVLEGLTDNKGKHNGQFETNGHYLDFGKKKDLKAAAHAKYIDETAELNLKCLWTKEYVKIYYNDVLVRIMDEPAFIYNLNQNPWMVNVMGMGLRKSLPLAEQNVSPLIVNYFIHYSLHD